ncbi:UDP-N-acetylmuramate dehydrogenase [Myroides guanonis]|uniref:UDP-N-acetylenolpyruvoylglucosamine reductase n=1 Tax=Myroides guanonis TaxID=1150112 RepID=A0A1I3NKP5_9FLAO|nr:UDP-N-acetylmuramate dehydrogenase [Myroides guanonis]SFJ09742.1 UDP-N-acetylmuramate dehydrogenase [Myroides guanonis]
MKIQPNHSLKELNTFGIDVRAKNYVEAKSLTDLIQLCKANTADQLFFLGGGSNMLLTKDIENTVVKIDLKGIEITKEDEDHVWIEVQAGENWHEFVLWSVQNNYGGLENLSLIPGNVGTTPIQNIGAYGVELKDVMTSCNTLEIKSQKEQIFTNEECKFGYRESVFKNEFKNQYIITAVTFKLSKRNHQLKTSYGAIQEELDQEGIKQPTIQDISKAVIKIRNTKLPNPKEIGNSGSFFKNPIVSKTQFQTIQTSYPNIPFYQVDENHFKVPAGWLIEKAGFKGVRYGDAGVHEKQALVLVNYGKATGIEIVRLAETIQKNIFELFQINIEAEVNIF